MLVFDTNVLIYAADTGSPFHDPCRERLMRACEGAAPVYLTWSIGYEFLRVTTHPRAPAVSWTSAEAWRFLSELLKSRAIEVLCPTARHRAVLDQTLAEVTDLRGNIIHDLHIAVLMREHGVSRICTRDTGFRRFPFLTVVDPLQ